MILLVDDQPEVREHVSRLLQRKGYRTDGASSRDEALDIIRKRGRDFALAIVDLDLGGGAEDGLGLIEALKGEQPDLPVIVLTGKGTIRLAVEALKRGAQDFLEKDLYIEETLGCSLDRVKRFLEIVKENRRLESENRDLRRTAAFARELQQLKYRPVGHSKAFQDTLERARRLASIPRPVLIRGERGSGKELIAATIHYAGARGKKPFISVNCAAFSGQLLESEMFGHEKGAFTGADKQKTGRFELADGGTLFLDEIGNMSPEFQEKLLRVVEYQEFERVGGTKPIKVDVRVLAATNADLDHLMDEGEFRRDLYDRLTFEVLRVPPLRERSDDIPLLAEFFAREFAKEVKLQDKSFSPDAMTALKAYRWPGNIRELKNVVERLIFSVTEDEIGLHAIPREVREGGGTPIGELGFADRISALEHELLEAALTETGWNQKQAAETLALTYDQFRHYYRKHGFKKPKRPGRRGRR